jgi:hypothetical protein
VRAGHEIVKVILDILRERSNSIVDSKNIPLDLKENIGMFELFL